MDHNRNIVQDTLQSPPIDTSEPYDPTLTGRTILITGGASGFGEGFARHWGIRGKANIIIGDINKERGKALVEEIRRDSGNPNSHFLYLDVTNWQSQVDFFRTAVELSPHGGIDAVVANAGIVDNGFSFISPQNLDVPEPPPPNLSCYSVNLTGVLYTAHLALFYLPRNPNSKHVNPLGPLGPRDRHLLLVGSVASLAGIPMTEYSVSKCGVLGLFRSLRSTTGVHGVRVNILCPYFIDTPLIPAGGRVLLAGTGLGKPEDVVDAGTRFMATNIIGRALVVGPKVNIDDQMQLVPQTSEQGKEIAVYEVFTDDFVQIEAFTTRLVKMLNQVEKAKGWVGWGIDMFKAVTYGFRRH